MKKLIFLLISIGLFSVWFFINSSDKDEKVKYVERIGNSFVSQDEENIIVVPYWTFTSSLNIQNYDSIIYFGITISEDGVDTLEDGYNKLSQFSELVPDDKKTYLTLRILGENATGDILENASFQKEIGTQTASIANSYGFDGIVVDFETSAFGFKSTEKKITNLYKNLNGEIKKENLEFLVTVFGDTYYRARPYNVREISLLSDRVIIMAYDFHKARLNPGPNFPFSNKEKYGYDFVTMIDDFKKDVAHEKIVVALGYFGYDWKMDKGVSVGLAEPLSLNQVEARFVDNCEYNNCKKETNKDGESVIYYEDNEGFDHEVWFEDEESVGKKIEFLNSKGINQIGFWAYSFF